MRAFFARDNGLLKYSKKNDEAKKRIGSGIAAVVTVNDGRAAFAVAGILCERRRLPAAPLLTTALVAGVLGLMLAGSLAAAGGFALGALMLSIAARRRFDPSRRRFLAVLALVLVVAGGVTAIRAD